MINASFFQLRLAFPALSLVAALLFIGHHAAAAPIRVLVWDEQQPAQKQAYANFLGNEIVQSLSKSPDLTVASARLDDPEHGLSNSALDSCDVLIWWGHQRHSEISGEIGREIVRRIKTGKLSLIALHSAHWSVPFVEAMNERARLDAMRVLSPDERSGASVIETNQYLQLRVPPKYSDRLTPVALYRKPAGAKVEITLVMPNCCFPAYRADGKPSQVHILMPGHPVAAGLPMEFAIPQTEMYCEPFHVPPPDEVIFEERWAGGEWFRSGSVWNLGLGRVFYFRPGHEVYPVFKDANVLHLLENAVRWLGAKKG